MGSVLVTVTFPNSLMNIKGREIEVWSYYACPYCGFGEGCLLLCEQYITFLPAADGALMLFLEGGRYPRNPRGIVLTREVGRVACSRDGDHILFDWRWEAER